jgi:hypothetical protein
MTWRADVGVKWRFVHIGPEVSQHNTIANKLSVQNKTGISENTLNMNKFTYKQKQNKSK